MKKFFLLLLAVIAAMPFCLKAESPADLFTWSAGPNLFSLSPMPADHTLVAIQAIGGRVPSNVTFEIPGSYQSEMYQIKGEKGETIEKEMRLLNMSKERVRVMGPGVPSGATTKNIAALYPRGAGVWPEEFNTETGRQKCDGIMVGFYGYESINEPGTYVFEFPAGAFYINGEPNEKFELEVIVNDTRYFAPTYLDFTMDPFVAPYELDKLITPKLTIENYEETSDGGWKSLYASKGINPTQFAKLTKQGEGGWTRECKVRTDGMTSLNRLGWLVEIDPENNNVITEPGKYFLEIPAGTIRLENNKTGQLITNQYLYYNFIVKDPHGNVTPPPGPDDPIKDPNLIDVTPGISPRTGTVTAIQSIQLEMPTGYQMFVPSPAVPFTMATPDGKSVQVTPRSGWAGHYVFLDFAEPFTAPGEYTLTIPSKGLIYFTATEDGDDLRDPDTRYFTEEQTFKYNVTWGTEGDINMTFSPANGSTVYMFENVYINFEDAFTPTIGMFANAKYPDGSTKDIKVTFPSSGDRAMISLNFPQDCGEYQLTIPAGIVRLADGTINKQIDYKVNFAEMLVEDVPVQTNPANGATVTSLDKIYILLPEGFKQLRLRDGGITKTYMSYPNGLTEMNYIKESGDEFFIDLKTKVTYSEETKGYYELTIEEGSLMLTKNDGQVVLNSDLRFVWNLDESGIYEVATADGMVTVYDMNGRMLLRNVPASALETLEKGIYIVNGAKTVIL